MENKSGLFWVIVERFGYSIIYFVVTIILARLLTPSDFGLIGSIAVLIAVSQIFVDSGFGGALIRKENVSKIDYDTVFTLNFLISISLYIVLYFSSPFIANFFAHPELSKVLKVLSLSFVFNGFAISKKVYLLRNSLFKQSAIASIIAVIISSFFSIIFALSGYSFWALVVQTVSFSAFQMILLNIFVRDSYSFVLSRSSIKSMFSFGGNFLLASILQVLVSEGITSTISKRIGFASSGNYFQSKKLIDFPVSIVKSISDFYVFPILSRVDNQDRFADLGISYLRIFLTFVFPFFTALFFCHEEIVLLIFGPQWKAAAPMLEILSIGSFFIVAEVISRNFIKAKSSSSIIIRSELLKRSVDIFIILFLIKYGLVVLLKALVISNFISMFINIVYLDNTLKISFYKHFKVVLTVLFLNLFIGFLLSNTLNFLNLDFDNFFYLFFYLFFFLLLYLPSARFLLLSKRDIVLIKISL